MCLFRYTQEYSDKIADLLAPQAGAYYDVWLDGEKVLSGEEDPEVIAARNDNSHGTNFEGSPEPIYGTQFLPRKFKIAITVPGDNSVDILTNDLGLVVMTDKKGELQGFNIYVGESLGFCYQPFVRSCQVHIEDCQVHIEDCGLRPTRVQASTSAFLKAISLAKSNVQWIYKDGMKLFYK